MKTVFTRLLFWCLFSFVLMISIQQDTQAQELPDACPEVVSTAVELLGDSCNALSTNTACYGYELVNTSFADEVPENYFTNPSDRAELSRINSIETTALDLDNSTWGLAVLNAQANVPNTLPGQGVMFILMGESRVENRVSADTVQPYIVPVNVLTQTETTGYLDANTDTQVISTLPANTNVLADAQDESLSWLRVVYQDRPMWIPRDSVNDALGLEALTVLSAESFTPMQAFYFNTGVGATSCSEAPNMVTVRSPENIQISLNINGADVRLGSMMTLQTVAENHAVFTLHEGQLDIVDTGVSVPAGSSIDVALDDEGTITDWGEVRPSTTDESQMGITPIIMYAQLNNDVVPQTQTISNPTNSDVLIHIVQAGDTLFSIARLYDTSMPEIVQVNNITNAPTIYLGQELIIPNPDSGYVGLDLPQTTAIDGTPEGTSVSGDCASLQPISPIDGMGANENTFYWNGVSGATSYRIRVTNLDSGRVLVLNTVGAETSLTSNVGITEIGGGFEFAWDVQALFNGEVGCTSSLVVLQRSSGIVVSGFTATWTCAGTSTAVITFMDAPAGDSISGSFVDDAVPVTIPITPPIAGPNGTTLPFASPGTVSGGTLTGTPSGTTIPVTPATFNVGAC